MLFRRRMTRIADVEFPPELDLDVYRSLHADLSPMDDDQLARHYERQGSVEGRQPNSLRTRFDFVAIIPPTLATLEIGPFCTPLLRGPNVSYFDVLSKEQLIARAKTLGWRHSDCPDIDYVSPVGDVSIVPKKFDIVVSSHAIEHQPDLIRHLSDVDRLLNPGGAYFLIIPDKRYCFDHYIPESTLAEVLDAHFRKQTAHGLRSVIEHRALTTHNDPLRHWKGDHGVFMANIAERVEAAMAEYEAANGGYIDVHAWYFSPSSFRQLIAAINETFYIGLSIERIYSTLYGTFEFFAILRKAA